MGRGTFLGGGTIVHPGSGFFSHKGGPGRKQKLSQAGDKFGPAPADSICDFSPLSLARPSRKHRVVIVSKIAREQAGKGAKTSPLENAENRLISAQRQIKNTMQKAQSRRADLLRQVRLTDEFLLSLQQIDREAAECLAVSPVEIEAVSHLLSELGKLRANIQKTNVGKPMKPKKKLAKLKAAK